MFDYTVSMDRGMPVEATPVDHALDQFSTALDHLVKVVGDGGLDAFPDGALVAFMQSFERVRNRMSLVDHEAFAEGERRGLPQELVQRSMRQVLVSALRLSPVEAARRVSAAEACGERTSDLGEVLPPSRGTLAGAQRSGEVSTEQVGIIVSALTKVDRPGFSADDVDAAEAMLTGFAATFGAKDLKRLADQTVEAMDPDGTLPDDDLARDRRHLTMRQCRDGTYAGEFRLTGTVGAKLAALLQPLSRPRVDSLPETTGAAGRVPDDRTFGQRTHDALEEVCDRVLRAGDVVGVGGSPATVIVTVTLDDLVQRLGYGTTSDGTLLSVNEVLALAGQADVVPTVMNRAGAVLALGRTRRIASTAQTHALVARDQGCSFPACDRAVEWCERHHIVGWVDNGRTDLDNLTLLCRYHHANFAQRGWRCRMSSNALPEWLPPRWVDPGQQPLMNSRVAAQLRRWRMSRRAPQTPSRVCRP